MTRTLRTTIYLAGVLMTMTATSGDLADHPTEITNEQLFAAINLDLPGLDDVRAAVAKGDYDAAAVAWAAYFAAREKPVMHYHRDTWAEAIRTQLPQLVGGFVQEADRAVAGDIRISNLHLPVDVEAGTIDWFHNPHKDTAYVGLVGTQWALQPVGRAYLLTGDEKYAQAFAWIVDSWYGNINAIRQWQGCGLDFDPIIRSYYPGVQSRILADNYYALARSPALTPAVHIKLMKWFLGACSWLYRQEARYRIGNQQVGAVVGLGVVGQLLPEFKDAEKWVERAERRMKEHLADDFHPDGGHKELCTQYHKAILRDISFVGLVAEANGRAGLFADPAASCAYQRALDWLSELVMPTGVTPPLHSAVYAADWAVYMTIGARHFNRPDFLWQARRYWERGEVPHQKLAFAHANMLICAGPAAASSAGVQPQQPDYTTIHLDSSGFAILRDGWDTDDRYLAFQYGWANTGHAYPQALAFLLADNGEVIATNPGSPRSYRHAAYKYCPTSRAGNAVTIDLADQPRVSGCAPGGYLDAIADMDGAWYVSAHHEGYKQPFGATIHRRLLVIEDGPVLVYDRIEGAAGHTAQWNFHTPLETSLSPGRRVRLTGNATYMLCPAFADEITQIKTERHWMAVLPEECQPDDCGREVTVLRYEKPIGDDGATFCIALLQDRGDIEPVAQTAFRVSMRERDFLVIFSASDVPPAVAAVATDAECLCIEYAGTEAIRAWIVNGTTLTVDGAQWLSAPEPRSTRLQAP